MRVAPKTPLAIRSVAPEADAAGLASTGPAQLRRRGGRPDHRRRRHSKAKTIADPVDLQNTAITSTGTYSAGLASFFASLAAWIGIYALFLIVKPVSRRAITALHSPLPITLGSVGQFLGLVLMLAQLVTAGGAFPWHTLPAPLAWLHHAMPMSYAVDGIRQLMYGGNPATARLDAGVLLIRLSGALVLATIGVVRTTHFRTLRDLRPSLTG